MVFFLTGVPGSGKTYYLVNYAEKNLQKVDKESNDKLYLQVVHNISGYKNGFYVDFGSDYLPKILDLYDYYLSIKKDINKDDLLIKKAEEFGIYKILLIVDECHLYFINDFTNKGKKQYYSLLWFISYHRHIFVDLVLSTQNLSLVDYKFKAFAEYFIKSVPSSMRFNLNPFSKASFAYNFFPDSKMWNETKFKTEKLKPDKKIFSLYTSGDTVKKQKVYLQTLLIIFFLFSLFSLLWFIFQKSFSSSGHPVDQIKKDIEDIDKNVTLQHKKISISRDIISYSNSDLNFDVVTCSPKLSGTCSSELTTNKIHYFFFLKLMQLNLIEVSKKETQYDIQKFYLILHISKDAYLDKFLIKPNRSFNDDKRDVKTFDFDSDEIIEKYKKEFSK